MATQYSQKRGGKGNNPMSPEKRKPTDVRVLDETLPNESVREGQDYNKINKWLTNSLGVESNNTATKEGMSMMDSILDEPDKPKAGAKTDLKQGGGLGGGSGGGLFGPNPFSNLGKQFQSITEQNRVAFSEAQDSSTANEVPKSTSPMDTQGNNTWSIFSSESKANLMSDEPLSFLSSSAMNRDGSRTLPVASSLGSNQSQKEKQLLLDMINSSFLNMPLVQDQHGIDVRSPLPVDDTISMCIDADLKRRMQAD